MALLFRHSGIALSSTGEILTGYGLTCRDPDGKFTLPYGPGEARIFVSEQIESDSRVPDPDIQEVCFCSV